MPKILCNAISTFVYCFYVSILVLQLSCLFQNFLWKFLLKSLKTKQQINQTVSVCSRGLHTGRARRQTQTLERWRTSMSYANFSMENLRTTPQAQESFPLPSTWEQASHLTINCSHFYMWISVHKRVKNTTYHRPTCCRVYVFWRLVSKFKVSPF